MTRGSKTTTEVSVVNVTENEIKLVKLPDINASVNHLVSHASEGRCGFQRPLRWLSKDILIIRMSGNTKDVAANPEDDADWYLVDVTIDIASGKIIESRKLENSRNEY